MDDALRDLVRQRAANRCEYCLIAQEHQRFARFHVDHIRPTKHRGADALSNLALACPHCNAHHGSDIAGFDPKTGAMVALFHPRRHKWHRHFRWHGSVVLGRTAIGRATIEVLAMNSPQRIELREELIAEGVFPPPGVL
jgi:hypothetical protein